MLDTDVVIIGAGPTGLMMACQLHRLNIRFRIIDKNPDRTNESRALVIHAKTMELFQNLGLAPEFLKKARSAIGIQIFVQGHLKAEADFKDIGAETTPFPSVYFLSQAETEDILIDHLHKQGVHIERNVELSSFQQKKDLITGQFFHQNSQEYESFTCRYLLGCDGAHSKVRHILNFKFEGAPYAQEFVLADLKMAWPYQHDRLSIFLSENGVLAHFPLTEKISRLIISESGQHGENQEVSLDRIRSLVTGFVKVPFEISDPVWISRFHLHHRIVPSYQDRNVFLAGDAAHIHSPAGGQGMNTGLQDASNLAWKLALVLKGISPEKLLETYTLERRPVGRKLLKTTDRFFSIATSRKSFVSSLRNIAVPIAAKLIFSKLSIRRRAFRFISELGIKYHENDFIWQKMEIHSSQSAPLLKAGGRAPDSPTEHGDLFELFKGCKFHILFFEMENGALSTIRHLKEKYQGLVQFHTFKKNQKNLVLFHRYGVERSAINLIRPDGYIGLSCEGMDLDFLGQYLNRIFESVPRQTQLLPQEPAAYLNF